MNATLSLNKTSAPTNAALLLTPMACMTGRGCAELAAAALTCWEQCCCPRLRLALAGKLFCPDLLTCWKPVAMQAAATIDPEEGGDSSLSDELFDKLLGKPEEQQEPGYAAPHTKLQVCLEDVLATKFASPWSTTGAGHAAFHAHQHGPQGERCVYCCFQDPGHLQSCLRSHMLQPGAVCCHALQRSAEELSVPPVLLTCLSADKVLPCALTPLQQLHQCAFPFCAVASGAGGSLDAGAEERVAVREFPQRGCHRWPGMQLRRHGHCWCQPHGWVRLGEEA